MLGMSKDISSAPELPDLDQIAADTKLVQRKSSKFTPESFLYMLMSAVARGVGSLNSLAAILYDKQRQEEDGPTRTAMSRQSLWERFGPASTAFLLCVLQNLLTQRYQPVAEGMKGSGIRRILVEDSTSIKMPKGNAEIFAAHGNHKGETAGVKIDFAYDLIQGRVVYHELWPATESDRTIGKELIPHVKAGDLVLRDMGYFTLNEFDEIEKSDARWLTRLPLTVDVELQNGISLEKFLNKTTSNQVDITVLVGKVQKKCRLVAVRVHKSVLSKRRFKRRKKAKECGKEISPRGFVRDEWHILLTNLTFEEASVSQLMLVYSARWAIEIQFRGWKDSIKLESSLNRRSNQFHMEALVLAGMIAHQLGMRIASRLAQVIGFRKLSYEKLYSVLAPEFVKCTSLAALLKFDPDPRHISRDTRRRQSPILQGIDALT